MIISEIYKKYSIMPNLALHQLRVAAVAKTILDALNMQNDSVISACLLHDMGNIIKFRLTDFPEFLEPQGLEYWEQVKADMIARYGPEEHIATYAIAEELAVSKETLACIHAVGFSKSIQNIQSPLAHKICAYADMRVGPHGVISLTERFEDGRKRYAGRTDRTLLESEKLEALYRAAYEIEQVLFEPLHIEPADITKDSIQTYMSVLEEHTVV